MRRLEVLIVIKILIIACLAYSDSNQTDKDFYKIYPQTNSTRPDVPSPFANDSGVEFVVAVTKDAAYAVIDVSLSNERDIGPQLVIDTLDFPYLVKNGIHSDHELDQTATITGRSLDEITKLGRPLGLSQAGFLAQDENVLAVIKGDNQLVKDLNLTHPQLAKPLFHVLNMMEQDLNLNRWNMARHRWENIKYFYYNTQKVFVEAKDTKGGQKSIFDDQIEGAFYIKLWREFSDEELQFLASEYAHLSNTQMDTLKTLLSVMHTGEMEPQYIMRYGFYEGHTFWRTDPLAISFVFGIRDIREINMACDGRLYQILTTHYID
jgi:hypothetical protein